MNPYIDCDKVYIKNTNHGLGVFARNNIAKGDIVERGIMFIVDGADGNSTPHLHTIDKDKNVWASGSGCINIYNHSENDMVFLFLDIQKTDDNSTLQEV